MEAQEPGYRQLLRRAAGRLTGQQRRLFLALVTRALCDGNPRRSEREFGWGRQTADQGLHELDSGIRCGEDFHARGRRRTEDTKAQVNLGDYSRDGPARSDSDGRVPKAWDHDPPAQKK